MKQERKDSPNQQGRNQERGYAMLSLLAAMTIAVIALGSALEPIKHHMQREKEAEMLWRGAQVADAINKYFQMRGGQFPMSLPTKLEDLTAEYNINGKKIHLIRPSAMHDPMMGDGEWKPVRIGDPLVGDFYRAYIRFAAEQKPPLQIPPMLQQAATMSGVEIKESKEGEGENKPSSASSQSFKPGSAFSLTDRQPIVGVISSSKEKMIRAYFGFESYDRALFFPGAQMPGGALMLVMGGIGGGAGGGDQGGVASKIAVDPNCPMDKAREGLCVPCYRRGGC